MRPGEQIVARVTEMLLQADYRLLRVRLDFSVA